MARRNSRKRRNKHSDDDERYVGRNWLAVHAHNRTDAGTHGDDRKEASRRACRGKIDKRDYE